MGTCWNNSSILDCGIFLPLQRNKIFWKGTKTNNLETEIDTFMPFDRFSGLSQNFSKTFSDHLQMPCRGALEQKISAYLSFARYRRLKRRKCPNDYCQALKMQGGH